MEKMRESPKPIFEKGMTVKMREDLEPSVYQGFEPEIVPGEVYRVMHVENDVVFGETAWLGPMSMSQQNIDDFKPELAGFEDRYDGVIPIVTSYLIRALH